MVDATMRIRFREAGDEWPGGFRSGEEVMGMYGHGVVATREYCYGRDPSMRGKVVRGAGIRDGLVPVVFDTVGCFWMSERQVRREEG